MSNITNKMLETNQHYRTNSATNPLIDYAKPQTAIVSMIGLASGGVLKRMWPGYLPVLSLYRFSDQDDFKRMD